MGYTDYMLSRENYWDWVVEDGDRALYENFFAVKSDKRYIDCEIIALPGEYDPKSLAFAYQLNSSYAWIFDYHINLIRENGVIDQASRKFKGPEQSCPDFRYAAVFLSTFVII